MKKLFTILFFSLFISQGYSQDILLKRSGDQLEVKVTEEYMGDIMGDISGKRGKILGMDSDGSFQLIKAQVPQGELYNYATTIRSLTGGRGLHSEEFSHYEKMPKDYQQKVIQETQKERDE